MSNSPIPSVPKDGLETFCRQVAEHFPNPIVRYDRDCRRIYANPALLEKSGLTLEEFLGKTPTQFGPFIKMPIPYESTLREVLATGRPAELDVPVLADGEETWAHIHFMPEWDADGTVSGVLTISHDITPIKVAEKRLQDLLETWPDEIARYDRNCRRIYVNPVMEDKVGTAEELLGRTPTETYPDSPEIAFFEAKLRETLSSGAVQDFEMDWNAPARRPRYRLLRLIPEHNSSGAVVGVLAIARDISERKRAEDALSRSEQQLRSVYESSPLPYQSLDASGRLIDINPAWLHLTGYARSEVVRRPLADFLTPESRPLHPQLLNRLRSGQDVRGAELGMLCKDGRTVLVEIDGRAVIDAQGDFRQTHCILHDITRRKESEQAMGRLNRALKTLSSGNEALVRAVSEAELLQRMCQVVVEVGGYRLAWIGFADQEGRIEPVAHHGQEGGFLAMREAHWRRKQGEDPVMVALRSGQVQVTHDIDSNPDYADCRNEVLERGFKSCVTLPLANEHGAMGVLAIYAAERQAFDEDEVRLLQEMAEDLAYGIHALRLRSERERFLVRLQSSMESTIQALASTVEMRDPYTAGHQRRVAELARAVAREMGCPEESVNALYLAGVVHDIGKIAIPAEILSKPGSLSRVQLELVRTHAEASYDILKGIEFPWPIAEIVHQHHERLDGSGYPNGLSGDSILKESRILAVCDVVEAMTTHRPYRPGLGLTSALAEIQRGRGSLYDPDVVDVCTRLLVEGHFSFD